MRKERFTERQGLGGKDQPIVYRAEFGPEVREKLLFVLTQDVGWKHRTIASTLRHVLRKLDTEEDAWDQVKALWFSAEWHRLFDVFEEVYEDLQREDAEVSTIDFHDGDLVDVSTPTTKAKTFEGDLNRTLREEGVGWEMHEGKLYARSGSDAQDATVRSAIKNLQEAGLAGAASDLNEALNAISRRPIANPVGAVVHSVGALEAAAKAYVGDPKKKTLGDLHKDLSSKLHLPKPLDDAVDKVYGYSSGYARHRTEGVKPTFEEAELVLGLCAAIVTYLTRTNKLP